MKGVFIILLLALVSLAEEDNIVRVKLHLRHE